MAIVDANKEQIEKFYVNLEKALKIKEKYKEIKALYQSIVEKNKKSLMTKNKTDSLYGMFLPDKAMEYITSEYKGTLTNEEEKKDFKYYFDDEDRVVLTERYSEKKLLNYIFYFYDNKEIDIIWYNVRDDEIIEINCIEHIQEKVRVASVSLCELAITFLEDILSFEGKDVISKHEGYFHVINKNILFSEKIRRYKKKES